MNRFVKRNTVKEIDINGHKFTVDFGRDDIRFTLWKVANEASVEKLTSASKEGMSDLEQYNAVVEAGKKVYEMGINEITGDPEASKKIFEDDNTSLIHGDIYRFLAEQFYEVIGEESPYNPKRIK